MSSQQSRRFGPGRTARDEVEQILSLVPGSSDAEAEALTALFACATGPARSGALAGEAAAVTAFRTAHQPPARAARRAKFLASMTTALTLKTAAAALAVTSVGGVVVAATTGVLPTPLTADFHHAHPPADRPTSVGGPTPDATVDGPAKAAAVRKAALAAAAADRADDQAGRDYSASYAGLCTAFGSRGSDDAGAAQSPAFARLVSAAPEGNVAAFCTALADEAPISKNSAPGKAKSLKAHEKAALNGKDPAARAKANNAKAPARGEKTADNGKAPATGKPAADHHRKAGTPPGPEAHRSGP
jgi:hypothetical protein